MKGDALPEGEGGCATGSNPPDTFARLPSAFTGWADPRWLGQLTFDARSKETQKRSEPAASLKARHPPLRSPGYLSDQFAPPHIEVSQANAELFTSTFERACDDKLPISDKGKVLIHTQITVGIASAFRVFLAPAIFSAGPVRPTNVIRT